MKSKRILVTGSAGFIGSHVLAELVQLGYQCLGLDNYNDYYTPNLKKERIEKFSLREVLKSVDLSDCNQTLKAFEDFAPEVVIHLAAQPGVRYSRISPNSYIQNNVIAFENVIAASKAINVHRVIYASSSSVYGPTDEATFVEGNRGGAVKNLYALTKRFNEDRISLEKGLESVGLRFFSVYGPWGRPDMAYFRMIGSVLGLWRFDRLGSGEQLRDYTYISDVVDLVVSMVSLTQVPRVLNVGGGQPFSLNQMQVFVEQYFGRPSTINSLSRDESEAMETRADTKLIESLGLPVPKVDFATGIVQVCNWAKSIPTEKYSQWILSSK